MTSLIKRLLLLVMALSVIYCSDATQNNLDSNDGGSIRFSVNWVGAPTEENTNDYHARALDCSAAGIETVSFEVMDESDNQLAYETFGCSLHEGRVDNVSPGTNRTLIVRGLDSESNEAYRGTVTGITVVLGEEANVGEVEALPCQTWYQDSDSDTYGDPSVSQMICPQPAGYVSGNTDCDDNDENIYPGATEDCSDGDDEDCDGDIDCDDSDCSDDIYCEIPTEMCSDGRDNDGDGSIDCNDADCATTCSDLGYYTNNQNMTFKLIPAGTFTMGSPDGVSEYPIGSGNTPTAELGRVNDETPHQVTLTKSFYIQTTEATQEQWATVMGNNPSYYSSCVNNCPVENVSWNDIQIYLAQLNNMGEGHYRLPTEAEWEYVARAGSESALANGDISVEFCEYDSNLNNVGWYCNNAGSTPHRVAQKQANAWGIFDMHGNVWEWVQDWYDDYPSGSVTDPTGPISGSERVERGGSIFSDARRCRSATRSTFTPDTRRGYLGFRLVYEGSVEGFTVQLPATGQTTSYATGDDGDLQRGVAWPTPRFTDNTDGTVTDELTGLMWLNDANCIATQYPAFDTDNIVGDGSVPWQKALNFVAGINDGTYTSCGAGYTDWHLPNVNELESLLNAEESNSSTWLNGQGFTNVQSDLYWSSTTSYVAASAWVVNLWYGHVSTRTKTIDIYNYVWPVRSATSSPTKVWKTGQTTSHDANDPQRDDGALQTGVPWPSPRFTDNADGTVTDELTGLLWTQDANSPGPAECTTGVTMVWQDALSYVDCLNTNNYLGYNNWHLPNKKELYSLTDFSQFNPALQSGHPFIDVQSSHYWSSTTYAYAYNTDSAWRFNMNTGNLGSGNKTNYLHYVWPVHAGQ